MNKLFLSLLAMFFLVKTNVAQDTLKMLNGNVWIVKIEQVGDHEVSFYSESEKKSKLIVREKRNIFSMVKKGEQEEVFYKYNPDIGNFYKLDEMKVYMVGERHANKHYKSNVSNVLSLVGGLATGYVVSEGTTLAAVAPFVFSSVIMIPGAKVREHPNNSAYIKDQNYREGYKRVAKGKKFINSLKYGAIGTVASFLTFSLID